MGVLRATARAPLLASPYPLLIRTSIALGLLAGFSLGLYLILGFGFGLPLSTGTPALIQAHGQIQALGFVTLFIMAVGIQLFPRFHGSRLDQPTWVSLGGLGLAGGVVLRALSQPVPPSTVRSAALLASALLELAGAILAVAAFARVFRHSVSPPSGGWAAVLPATLGGSLFAALLLNVYGSGLLAVGSPIVPLPQDEALLHLELWGFAASMVLVVSGRVFPRFLLLRPSYARLLQLSLVLWAAGNAAVPVSWLVAGRLPLVRAAAAAAQLLGALLFVVGLRLYEMPLRASGTPHVTNPTRLWARCAFGFLLAAAAIDLGVAVAEAAGGGAAPFTSLSAARHALAQGFLLPMIITMASRILPGYSGDMMRHPRLLAALVWALLVGAALRSVPELVGGYASGWGSLVGVGGTVGTLAFVVFGVGLWRATGLGPHT